MYKKNKENRARHCLSVVPIALLMVHGGAYAQSATISPGTVLDSLAPTAPRLPSAPPQVVFPVQTAPSEHSPRARRFRVNAFDMSGNTVYKERLLKRLLERFVDRELNLYDLNRAADTITDFYHSRGYTLARAVIPPQKVAKGVVNIHIVEGRIGKVSLVGNQRYSSPFIAKRTGLLQRGSLVTTGHLENTLLLLNDLPGLSAKVVLAPGEAFGETDAEINLAEKLFSGSLSLNNYGRKETGQNKLELGLSINAPFGWGDQLSFSGSSTDHQLVRHWKTAYSFPLNTLGTRLTLAASNVEYQVSGALAILGIGGEVDTQELLVSHPFARSRNMNQTLIVGLKRNKLTQTVLDTPFSGSEISFMTASYQLNHIHADSAVTNASFGFASNFKSVETSTQQDALFARFELDINHTAPLTRQWDMYLRANYVHSSQMLPDTERFSLGGPGSVRGYRPSEVRGDSGYLGTLELRRPFDVGGKLGVFRVTADSGLVTYRAPGNRDTQDKLHSVGLGVAVYPAKGVIASIDVARIVGDRPSDPNNPGYVANEGKDSRLWMSISANF